MTYAEPGPFDPPLTPIEAAAALNIKRSLLYTLLKAGQIASVKVGGATRIKTSEINRFYENLPPAQYKPLGPKQGVRRAQTAAENRPPQSAAGAPSATLPPPM